MAFALKFDGVDDRVDFPTWQATGDFSITGTFKTPAIASTGVIIGRMSGGASSALIMFNSGILRMTIGGTALNPGVSGLLVDTFYIYTMSRVGTAVTLDVSTLVSENYTNGSAFILDAFGDIASGSFFDSLISSTCSMVGDPGGARSYNFNQQSGLVLPETLLSQNGTLVNFPIDNSQWVDIGGDFAVFRRRVEGY